MEAGCRWMNGHDMCDALGLGKPSLYYYLVFAGHNVIVATLAYSQRLVPVLDRFLIQVSLTCSSMIGNFLTFSNSSSEPNSTMLLPIMQIWLVVLDPLISSS
jgi:hypothetical protein